jgi:hypothetical protein
MEIIFREPSLAIAMKEIDRPDTDPGRNEKSEKTLKLLVRIGIVLGILGLIEVIILIYQASRPPV